MSTTVTEGYWSRATAFLVVGMSLLLFTACSGSPSDLMSTGFLKRAPGSPSMAQAKRADSKLAYEHTIGVELPKELLPLRVQELRQACAADRKFGCTLLDVLTSEREEVPIGSVKVRLAPAGVEAFITIASKGGHVIHRTTHAEDLTQSVADTERQLALLTTHRDRLSEFMKDKALKVDQLITVSKELATVQSQLDELKNQHANLSRRIDTELLSINLALPDREADREQHPITDAVQSFWTDFRLAVAHVIGFVAALLPWLVVLVPGLILLRLFWRWIGRWMARREQRRF